MIVETEEDYEKMKAASHVVAIVLKKMKDYAEIGMSTKEIDEYGGKLLKEFGAKSAPFVEYKFPGFTCISTNNEACHGVPSEKRILKNGDLINIDVSANLEGYYGDNGCSFIMGEDIQNLSPLVNASHEILTKAIAHIKPGEKINSIGELINNEARKRGFNVIRNICGHGIGKKLHDDPGEIACWKDRMNRRRFRKNSAIALETFISTKAKFVYEEEDGWTLSTKDGSFVAQHEHTMIIRDGLPEILTWENGI